MQLKQTSDLQSVSLITEFSRFRSSSETRQTLSKQGQIVKETKPVILKAEAEGNKRKLNAMCVCVCVCPIIVLMTLL